MENTIKPSIIFEDINLLWTFTTENGEIFTNMNLFRNDIAVDDRNSIYNTVASTFIKLIQLNEHEKKVVVMKLTPRLIGQLEIKAVVGKISVSTEYMYIVQYNLKTFCFFCFCFFFPRRLEKHQVYGEN